MPGRITLAPRALGAITRITAKSIAQKNFKVSGYEAKQFGANTPIFLGAYTMPTPQGIVVGTVGLKFDETLTQYLDELNGFAVSRLSIATQFHQTLGQFFSATLGSPLMVHAMPPFLGELFQNGFALSIHSEEGTLEWMFFDGFVIDLDGGLSL